jgi:hypothetical protein
VKPDLILVKKGICCVVDPMIMADNGDLDKADLDKASKYQIIEVERFATNLHNSLFPSKDTPKLLTSGAVMDWRGCWSCRSATFLKKIIGIPPKILEYMSVRSLLSSRMIWSTEQCRAD